eukprot:m.34405 g.34405  ORF g.34405 m.34405 type:complete len:289 (+) comp15466_c0_seq1:298-1164(+)
MVISMLCIRICRNRSFFIFRIDGEKQFVLFPPEEHRRMHLYPIPHVQTRQSQINVTHDEQNQWLRDLSEESPQAQVVRLQPGDVLFLPAYWFHQVTAVSLSLSVNIFSYSREARAAVDLRAVQLPSILTASPANMEQARLRTRVLARLLRHIITFSLSSFPVESDKNSAEEWLKENIINARYTSKLQAQLNCEEFDGSKCPHDGHVGEMQAQLVQECARQLSNVVASLATSITAAAPSWAQQTTVTAHVLSLRDILLADYIEDVTAAVVGAEHMCGFLRCVGTREAFS